MDRYEIQRNINYYQNEIYLCTQEINKLEQQIRELESLSSKLEDLRSRFNSKQASRKRGISKFSGRKNVIKAISAYHSGMYLLLNGSEANSVNNGLGTAKQEADNKRISLESRLNTVKSDLSSNDSKLDYWEDQLQSYQLPC